MLLSFNVYALFISQQIISLHILHKGRGLLSKMNYSLEFSFNELSTMKHEMRLFRMNIYIYMHIIALFNSTYNNLNTLKYIFIFILFQGPALTPHRKLTGEFSLAAKIQKENITYIFIYIYIYIYISVYLYSYICIYILEMNLLLIIFY